MHLRDSSSSRRACTCTSSRGLDRCRCPFARKEAEMKRRLERVHAFGVDREAFEQCMCPVCGGRESTHRVREQADLLPQLLVRRGPGGDPRLKAVAYSGSQKR
eukprot:6121731-Pleurochrysis_carterae.AAC.3